MNHSLARRNLSTLDSRIFDRLRVWFKFGSAKLTFQTQNGVFLHEKPFLVTLFQFSQQNKMKSDKVKVGVSVWNFLAKMLNNNDPTEAKLEVEHRLQIEEDSVAWLSEKIKQSSTLTTTMTGRVHSFKSKLSKFKWELIRVVHS